MARDNLEAIHEGYRVWNEQGLEAALADFIHPEIELHDLVEMPDGSVYHRHQGAREMWAQWTQAWEEFEFSLAGAEDLGGDHVLAQVRASGRLKGTEEPIEVSFYEVWTLRDGKGIKRVAAMDRASVLSAAGLED
jgi:ketosteroid isomerase-like protein